MQAVNRHPVVRALGGALFWAFLLAVILLLLPFLPEAIG